MFTLMNHAVKCASVKMRYVSGPIDVAQDRVQTPLANVTHAVYFVEVVSFLKEMWSAKGKLRVFLVVMFALKT